ncbi:hypothetical protein ACJMK2_038556 [Sinanodonta woodiana]|uniref:RING-type domain-containing protein n=1 Tax=Sinanodonta woodiana TaxID=1069815 RepID=A0ABD3W9C2_SINWO
MESRPTHRADTLECPLCLEEFSVPRTLPCLHSYCQSCLQSYINGLREKNEDQLALFPCPVCTKETSSPSIAKTIDEWASAFPQNSLLVSLLSDKAVRGAPERACDPCMSTDNNNIPATGFCATCNESLCPDCIKAHKKNTLLKAHIIVGLDDVSKNPQMAVMMSSKMNCTVHLNKEIEFYCKDHYELSCNTCAFLFHRGCANILELKVHAQRIIQDHTPADVIDKMKSLESHLGRVMKANEANLEDMDKQVNQLPKQIRGLRQKLDKVFEDLEYKLWMRGEKLHREESTLRKGDNKRIQSLLAAIKNSYRLLERIMQHASDSQIFITLHKVEEQLAFYEREVRQHFSETHSLDIQLRVNEIVEKIAAMDSSTIAQLEVTEKRLKVPSESLKNVPEQPPTPRGQVQFSSEVNLKTPDGRLPLFTGAAYLPENKLMLVDSWNHRIYMFSSAHTYITDYKLPSPPTDVCLLNTQEVAVALPKENKIQFASVTGGRIKYTMTLTTQYPCFSLAQLSVEELVVAGMNKDRYYWAILNSSGTEKSYVGIENRPAWSDISYLALNKAKTRLLVSCYGYNALYCYNLDSKLKRRFIYKTKELEGPTGVGVDSDDTIYVAGFISRNIHQLTEEGIMLKILSSDSGIPSKPRELCFNERGDEFLVTNSGETEKGHIFKISWPDN